MGQREKKNALLQQHSQVEGALHVRGRSLVYPGLLSEALALLIILCFCFVRCSPIELSSWAFSALMRLRKVASERLMLGLAGFVGTSC